MKLVFSIDYYTTWGQIVCVDGSLTELTGVEMVCVDGSRWSCTVNIPDDTATFSYSYFVKNQDGGRIKEWGTPRSVRPVPHAKVHYLYDQWIGRPYNSPFFSSAFTKAFFLPAKDYAVGGAEPTNVTFRIFAPEIPAGKCLAVVGGSPALGQWKISKNMLMSNRNFPEWEISVEVTKSKMPVEYKFVMVDPVSMSAIRWENGNNRILPVFPKKGEQLTVHDGIFRGNTPSWRCAGVAIPVFSLRSENSCGIGDFIDLKKMIDWAAKTGQRVVQLLPVNDTTMTHTWTDSYPYNANTIFALHPLYLGLAAFGKLKEKAANDRVAAAQQALNALPEVDYEAVSGAKWDFYKAAFAEKGASTLQTKGYGEFFEQNREWLVPYSVFCYLRDKYQTVDFHCWGEFASYNKEKIEQLYCSESGEKDHIVIHSFLQYYLHCQLKEASDYARLKGVILKGDIPIGISPDSMEAWTEPHLFNLDSQTGAPPDDFSITGQNWGFPTYNWDRMRQDGFSWWRRRFAKMADYFDAYRIDHLLGFFRIWEIPMEAVQGLLGHFSPALPMPKEELNANGFWLDEERHLKPYIRYYQLNEMFGDATGQVIDEFLTDKGHGVYELKPEVDTQRKIERYFEEKGGDLNVRDGLYALVAEVLFVSDPHDRNKFHPRITAQYTYSYKALSDNEKYTFDRLYDHFFYQRHNYFWSEQAMQKLPDLIASTDMLACAEDLGMIPACVPYVMNQLQMLSLEIQRMPKDPTLTFADTRNYPYLSVCTTSTHDMSTLRAWWEEDGGKRQRYYNEVLGQWGEAPVYGEPWICSAIVRNHLWAPSMLTILPLQDWLSIDAKLRRDNPNDERINIPANPRHYWRYRMHLTLEQLLASDSFNEQIRTMIVETGR
jgi:4-alpha-glucanotransferase